MSRLALLPFLMLALACFAIGLQPFAVTTHVVDEAAAVQTFPPVPQQPATNGNTGATQSVKRPGGCNTQSPIQVSTLPSVTLHKDGWDIAYIFCTWLLVVVGVITLALIRKQVHSTADAAKAARLNAQALIDAERPWIVVKPDFSDQIEGQVYFRATNIGRTPAQIVSNCMEQIFVEAPDNKFPDPATWKDPLTFPAMLAPNDSFSVSYVACNPENIVRYRKSPPLTVESLCFCGKIQYRDVINTEAASVLHESCWCYSYSSTVILGQSFFNCGPERYNHYT